MSQAVPLESLLQNQQDLHRRISKAYENLKKIGSANYTAGVLESRMQSLEQNWRKFENQHEYMQLHYREKLSASVYVTEDTFGSAEESYLQNKGQFLDILAKLAPATKPEVIVRSSLEGRPASSLPRIQLPHFSGKYSEWLSFRDLFASLIRKDSTLTDVEKLHYLKSCVKGEAEDLLKNINITSQNFDLAWQTLCKRYENKRVIVRAHLGAITSLPVMPKESSDELKRVLHTLYSSVGGLANIGRPIDQTADLLVHIIVDRLDARTKRAWEDSISGSVEPPSYDDLKGFLENRLRTLEALSPPESTSVAASQQRRSPPSAKAHLVERSKSAKSRCPLCSKDHFVLFCELFKRMQPTARIEAISRHNLCSNCLGRHSTNECRSQRTCMKCAARHHTSIHDAAAPSTSENTETSRSALTLSYRANANVVLLATAQVRVTDQAGDLHTVRALIDPGSEVSLVSEGLVRRLHLRRQAATVPLLGVGASSSGVARGRVTLEIQSRLNAASQFKVSALILPRLTSYGASCRSDSTNWKHLHGLPLADPEFNRRGPIELLLGADIYATILEEGVCKGNPHTPIAQRTSLGWILSGIVATDGAPVAATSLQCSVDSHLEELVQRFWIQEELTRASPWSEEDTRCENFFRETHFRLQDGRYVVRLPLKDDPPSMAETRLPAARLLNAMEARFAKDTTFAALYRQFMTEYHQLDHMAPISGDDKARSCYLPHHGVLRKTTESAKIRVVFNGSQRLRTGESLNDYLLIGPKLIPDLSDVVLRWRRHKFVFATDMEKMYRQIRIHSADRQLQRILWRDNADAPIQEFELKTVTYGLASAPFLAIRTLHQLATDEQESFPRAAEILRNDVYVDDILSGASTLEDTLELQQQLLQLCMAGGFPLRKWVANDDNLLRHLPPESIAKDTGMTWEDGGIHCTLGLHWHPKDDCFSFSCGTKSLPDRLTKRTVLSNIAQVFDPLGLLAPSTIYAKVFFQSLWLQRLTWDTPLHPHDERTWRDYANELPLLEDLRISRFLGDGGSFMELHGFADASERAYAAVLYARCRDTAGHVSTSLLMAKTKVAPIKQVSLPRLELSAAVLLTRLTTRVQTALRFSDGPVHLWTDSMVVLGWIQGHPSKWKTFVANRVSEIQLLLPKAFWHHVPSKVNPADCASRGLSPRDLGGHSLWWYGPLWLTSTSEAWSTSGVAAHPDSLPEQRRTAHHAQVDVSSWELEQRFSSLDTLLRVTAWCQRWVSLVRRRIGSSSQPASHGHPPTLTTSELHAARIFWLKHTQRTHFRQEIEALDHNKTIPARSPLLKLNPMVDSQGLLRVGGRLKHSLLSEDERHPVILPSKCPLTRLITADCHSRTLHGGVQQTLALLRRRYWILQGRASVKACIHQCPTCVRWRAATVQPLMGDLPRDRVIPTKPFTTVGLDYAGPMTLRTVKGRGHKSYKGYLAIFVCFATKAVHVELVSDYTSDAFLAAFRRFTSRRGLCKTLYSDCGTNFVGADAQIRQLFKASSQEFQSIQHQLQKDGLEWRFNPPAAPHFGGLWEGGRQVGQVPSPSSSR